MTEKAASLRVERRALARWTAPPAHPAHPPARGLPASLAFLTSALATRGGNLTLPADPAADPHLVSRLLRRPAWSLGKLRPLCRVGIFKNFVRKPSHV